LPVLEETVRCELKYEFAKTQNVQLEELKKECEEFSKEFFEFFKAYL